MKTISAAVLVPVAVLAAFTVWITARAKSLEEDFGKRDLAITETGKMAPNLSLPALDGNTVSLAAYRGGKNLLIAFGAYWCSPCRLQVSLVNTLYQRSRGSNHAFDVLVVAVDDDRAGAQWLADALSGCCPVLLDPTKKSVDAFHVESLPSLVLVNPEGRIIFGATGIASRTQMELAQKLGIPGSRFGGMDGRGGN